VIVFSSGAEEPQCVINTPHCPQLSRGTSVFHSPSMFYDLQVRMLHLCSAMCTFAMTSTNPVVEFGVLVVCTHPADLGLVSCCVAQLTNVGGKVAVLNCMLLRGVRGRVMLSVLLRPPGCSVLDLSLKAKTINPLAYEDPPRRPETDETHIRA
jgi:hypothetical protein